MNQSDVTAMCDEAQKTLDLLPEKSLLKASFKWKGQNLVAVGTIFGLRVETHQGELVARRYD